VQESLNKSIVLPFLQGGGEMGERIRNYDWENTPVGSSHQWPQSLRAAVGLVIHSSFPMLLFWGKSTLISFYNDAFRPSLGENGKHPAIGQHASEMWSDIWDYIGPLLQKVMDTGEAAYFENQLVPFYRNGGTENTFWTFSYSPAYNDEGEVDGVFVVCKETTEALVSYRKMEESEARFRNMAESADVLIAISDETSNAVYFNKAWVSLTGRPMEKLLSFGWADLVHPDDRERYLNIYLSAFKLREAFTGEFRIQNSEGLYRRLLAKGATRFDNDGTFSGYISSCIDITEQLEGRRLLQQNEMYLQLLSNTVPAMIFYLDSQRRYQSYNEKFNEWFHVEGNEAIGKSVSEFLGNEAYEKVRPHLDIAYAGTPEQFEMFAPSRMYSGRWLNIIYTPHINSQGKVLGVIVHATDITDRKRSEIALRESETRFRAMIEEAPVATCFFVGREMRIELANELMLDLWARDRSIIGMPLEEALPYLKGQPFLDILDKVYSTGQSHSESAARAEMERDGKLNTRYFNFTYKPLLNDGGEVYGIIDMAIDVTEQVLMQQKIDESRRELLKSFNDSPVGIAIITGDDLRFKMVNPFYAMLTGRPSEELIDKPLLVAMPELAGQGFDTELYKVMQTGESFHAKDAQVDIVRGGKRETIYIDHTYQPQKDDEGNITGVLVVVVEVTQKVATRRDMEEKEMALRNAIELAELGTWTIDVATGQAMFSQRHLDMFGLTVSSITADEASMLIVDGDRERVRKLFYESIEPGSDGIYQAEYEVVNATTGEHIMVKAQGQVYYNEEGKPVKISGTTQDVTIHRKTQAALEAQVQRRTKELADAIESLNQTNRELKRSNANLEEFAHAASHDLKEPVRKILFFAQRLKEQLKDQLTETESFSFSRIENATKRMGNLIDDLLLYSHVSQRPHEKESIDLNVKMKNVLEDLELDIQEKNAKVQVGRLPNIMGYRRQLQQLFQNLISNSLKYSKAGEVPEIDISAANAEENQKLYHVINIKDNGIGFEQQYENKIFQMFTRLHGKQEYSGTGVGLSIAKKVVENHNGFIRVESKVGEGSVFRVYLPA
jgi:PAS domain S-box-containing protein